MGRGNARRSSLRGRERAIINQTNIETWENIGNISERRGEGHTFGKGGGGIFGQIETILN